MLAAALAAVTLAAASSPAVAATTSYSYRVELAGSATKSRVHAGGVDWECRSKYCIASAPGGNVSVRGCKELASQVGRVVSYRSEIKQLAGDQIDQCNAAVASAKPPPGRAPTTAGGTAEMAKQPERPARVTTEELTFTGVHKWNPAK
ncbi:MAG: hypothetical protein WCE38_19575 [Burkholderiales bacterium]